ncbi:amidase signature domain-containing protein [Jimgerdemannia flammicorona]|uniref:Amidase signature domain-containing protein n=1 Tax=Jimgerdemannia flammicorona TaxID=994334 RepID=A0A433Q745_9FUNG|nr:amidase signature domain-containing protein [Jimgerdemannia flammicorona]
MVVCRLQTMPIWSASSISFLYRSPQIRHGRLRPPPGLLLRHGRVQTILLGARIEALSYKQIHSTPSGCWHKRCVMLRLYTEYFVSELDPAIAQLWCDSIAHLRDRGATIVPHRIPHNQLIQLPSPPILQNYFLQAQKVRRLVQQDFDHVFLFPNPVHHHPSTAGTGPGVHVLLSPAANSTAPKIQDCFPSADGTSNAKNPADACVGDVMTVPACLAGIPAIVVPFGVSPSDGYPVGLQLMAQYGDEKTLIEWQRRWSGDERWGDPLANYFGLLSTILRGL